MDRPRHVLSAVLGTSYPILANLLGELIAALQPDTKPSTTLRIGLLFFALATGMLLFSIARVRTAALPSAALLLHHPP